MNKNSLLLITTALEKTWKSEQPVIFLGEWCRLYNRKHIWNKMNYKTIPWHWSDRAKLAKDCDYLDNLYETLLIKLTFKLNEVHKVNYDVRYWRIIIGTWLLTYIPVLWDRWESIRILGSLKNDMKTVVPNRTFNNFVPDNYNQSITIMTEDDKWNYFIYSKILKFQNHKNIKLIKCHIPFIDSFKSAQNFSDSFVYNLAIRVDKIIGKILRKTNSNFVLYKSYFPYKFLLKVFFKFRQFPRLYSEFEKQIIFDKNSNFIRPQFKEEHSKSNFENFLYSQIFNDMPKAYLEGYKKISKYCESLTSAKIIFTANAHFANEVFKNWAAKQVNAGAKLIISSHGGALSEEKSLLLYHEEKICDIKTVYYRESNPKYVKLTPNKLVRKINVKRDSEQITLVGLELPRYSYRAQTGPNSSLIIEEFNQKVSFINSLNKKNRDFLKIRPYSNRGWFTKERYSDLYGEKIISKNKSLFQDFSMSKLIVCSYPQTTFLEAMHSGIPTVLLYKKEYWELNKIFNELVAELEKVNIIFSDSKKAAKFVNNISGNPKIWWNTPEIIKAKKMFFHFCGSATDDPFSEWSNFFETIK